MKRIILSLLALVLTAYLAAWAQSPAPPVVASSWPLADLHQFADIGLIALRFAVALIFGVHGAHKWAMWKMLPSEQVPARMLGLLKFLSIVEPLGAIAVLAGFLTQLAAAGLSIIMLGAILVKARVMKVPFTDAKNQKVGWEYDFILLAAAVALFFFGAGRFSLDQYFFEI